MLYGYLALLLAACGISSPIDLPTYSTCSPSVTIIKDKEARITSPMLPEKNKAKLSCHWRIVSESEMKLIVENLDISSSEYGDTANDTGCAAELQISVDGNPITHPGQCAEDEDDLKKEWDIRKVDYNSLTVDIIFTSHHGYEGTGFSISYETEIPLKNCNYTRLGILCQRWDVDYPHVPAQHPLDGGEHNFCRNPDNDYRGPWCYTVNPRVRWEYCIINDCDGPYTPLVSFQQGLWYPLLGVTGVISLAIMYICLRHRYKKLKESHTQPVGVQAVPMVDIIDDGQASAMPTAKESMLSSTS